MYDAIVGYMRATARTVGAMGVMGLLLALAGLYGLVAYAVSTRTQEIGIRMALGADRGSVLRMVLRHAFMLATAGIVAGVALTLAVGRLLDAFSPDDSNSGGDDLSNSAFAVMVLVVLALTMLAAYIPARRAARVDPNVALRCE